MLVDFLQRGETVNANLVCRCSTECDMHFVTNSKQRDPAIWQGTTSRCTDICGYWGVWLGSSVSYLHGGLGPVWCLGRSHKGTVLSTGMMWQFRKLCVHGCRILKWTSATAAFWSLYSWG